MSFRSPAWADGRYNQSHAPLHEQDTILGHSVRALYLTTAAADLGGKFLNDAERLFMDAVDHKMYATGGLGTEPGVSLPAAAPLTRRLKASRRCRIGFPSRLTKADVTLRRVPRSPP